MAGDDLDCRSENGVSTIGFKKMKLSQNRGVPLSGLFRRLDSKQVDEVQAL